MKKNWLLVISMVLVLAIVGLAGCSPNTTALEAIGGLEAIEGMNISVQQEGIWVSGTGEVTVIPDVAILSLSVEAQAITVAEAQAQAAVAMDAVMGVLNDYSVASKDIKTQYYSIYPLQRWDDGTETLILIGYQITNTVTVKIRTIEDSGDIIDAVTLVGGDYTRISGISFTVDDPETYYEEAREKAMSDAKAKAEQLAELAGVTLGKPTYIVESSGYSPIYYDLVKAAEGATAPETPISPGETEISLSVQVVYSIN